jgi:ABC-2 type transport system permease protein
MFVRRAFLLETHFKFSFLTSLLNTSSDLVIYGMIATFGQNVPEIAGLSGGYVNYVITGMVVGALMGTALAGPYTGLLNAFWDNRVEMILVSPLRLPVFAVGVSAGTWVPTATRIVIYLLGGTLFLGFTWPAPSGLLAFVVVIAAGILACTGLGLMAASMIYMIDARGGRDPIRFVVENIAGLVAGVYFPLQVLPVWAQWLAHLIPHTFALDGARRALYGLDSVPPLPVHDLVDVDPLLLDVLILLAYAAVAVPVGWRLFHHGMELARKDGRLSRWL